MTRYLVKRVNRELARSKFRAVGSGALILVAVAAYISFSAMMPSAERSLEAMVEEQNISDFIVHFSNGSMEDETIVSGIAGIETVDHRITISSRTIYIDANGAEQMVPASLVGVEPGELPLVNTLNIAEGNFFGGSGTGTVVLEGGFAKAEGIAPGDSLRVQTPVGYLEWSVIGLAYSPEHIMMPMNPQSVIPLPGTLAVIYAPIDSLRDSFGLPEDYINELLFLFDGSAPAEQVMNDITEALSVETVTFTQEKDELYGYSLIKEDLSQGQSFTGAIAFLILLAAFFVTYSFFSRVVDEERKQIGVMRALGYTRLQVLSSYLYMAALIGLGGSIVGTVIGIPTGNALAGFYVEMILHSQTTVLVLEPEAIVLGLLFGPVTTGLACAIAVWSTVSLEPHEAIKDMRTRKVRRAKRTGRQSTAHTLSYISLYTVRNISRRKRRTAFTAVAIGFSIVMGAMSFLMVESFANSISESITEHEHWDLVVDYSYPLDSATADSLVVAEIEEAVKIARLAVIWRNGGTSEQAILTGLPSGQDLHEYALIRGELASSSSEIMVGYATSRDYGLEPGDIIELETGRGSVSLTISAVLADTVGEMVVNTEVIAQLADVPVFSGMYVRCSEEAVDAVVAALESQPYVANVQLRDDIEYGMVEFMQSYNTALYAFSMVGVTIATLTIANVVFMGVLERKREYGQLRAIGYSKRATSKSVVVEILIMIAVGSAVAVPLLWITMESMVGMFREFWPIYSTVLYLSDWYGYVVVVFLTLAFGLLASLPAIRYIGRMDIAKAVAGGRFG